MKPVAFDYHQPEDLPHALDLFTHGAAQVKLLAGGQTLGPMMNLRLARPGSLVDISGLDELRSVVEKDNSIVFGSAVTHAEIEDGLHPDPLNGGMQRVAAGIAYRVVRNKGTIGGSLAHADPSSDWLNFSVATDAMVLLRSPAGQREVAVTDFLLSAYTTVLADNETIIGIEIPTYPRATYFGYHKQCRKVGEFADAIGITLVAPDKHYCRVVAGAIGPKPFVLHELAQDLAGQAVMPTIDRIKAAVAQHAPNCDLVKLHMAAVSVRRSMEQAWRK